MINSISLLYVLQNKNLQAPIDKPIKCFNGIMNFFTKQDQIDKCNKFFNDKFEKDRKEALDKLNRPSN